MTRQPTGSDAGAQLSRSMILQTALSIVDRDGVKDVDNDAKVLVDGNGRTARAS